MERPWTSLAAQYYAMASLFVVFVSTLTFILSTVEDASDEVSSPAVLMAIEVTGKWEDMIPNHY